jgi:hypothetical protein
MSLYSCKFVIKERITTWTDKRQGVSCKVASAIPCICNALFWSERIEPWPVMGLQKSTPLIWSQDQVVVEMLDESAAWRATNDSTNGFTRSGASSFKHIITNY